MQRRNGQSMYLRVDSAHRDFLILGSVYDLYVHGFVGQTTWNILPQPPVVLRMADAHDRPLATIVSSESQIVQS